MDPTLIISILTISIVIESLLQIKENPRCRP